MADRIRDFTQEHARALFLLAGFNVERAYEMVNGYWQSNVISGPWWLVKTDLGLIRVGWRKRVLEIEWADTPVRERVTDDQTTSEENYVHAWTYDRALAYLSILRGKLLAKERIHD